MSLEGVVHKQHYCSGCKRMLPLAPGTSGYEYGTIGVAHVVNEPMCFGVPCWLVKSYSRAEQRRNLEEMVV